jgi:hypothetical protein
VAGRARAGRRSTALRGGIALAICLLAILGASASSALASTPTLTIDPVTNNSIVTAHLSGEVEVPADGSETYWCLETAEAGTEAWSGFCYQGPIQPGETATVEQDVSGLKAETSYEARLSALNFNEFVEEHSAPVSFATDPATSPILALDPASAVTSDSAHLSGSVDPEGGNVDAAAGTLPIAWELQLDREGSGWSTVGSGELSGPEAEASTPQAVAADATGLIPNSTYATRLLVHYAGREAEAPEGSVIEFTTEATAPTVGEASIPPGTPTSWTLTGTVNPHNSPLSDCHFSYGVGAALDNAVPCESVPSGSAPSEVRAKIAGLQPGTEYSFQLVAANQVGSDEGPVLHFSTPTESGGCPNEAIRIAQHATQAGDCRAWERVSPADKGGGDLIAEGEPVAAAADGDGATFRSRYGFADTVGSGNVGRIAYLARRGAEGWSTHAITPPGRPDARQIIGPTTHTEIFSADLSHALTFGYELPGATGDAPERMNMYLEDTATRGLTTISSSQRGNGEDPIQYWANEFFGGVELYGASEDLNHVTIESWTQFLPAGTAPGYPQGEPLEPSFFFPYAYPYKNVYTWDEGTLHLASILPDGSAPPEGARVEGGRGSMSADGSAQTFLASPEPGAPQQLYLRIDHERTDLVSESENPAFTEGAQELFFEGMTPNGKNVFFVTNSPLLEEDENEGPDLYRWTEGPDPEHEANLSLITRDGNARHSSGVGGSLVGMSDDGNRVYVHNNRGTLELWEAGSGIKMIDSVKRPIVANQWLTLLTANPGLGRVSPDGNWVAYVTDVPGDQRAAFGGAGVLHLFDRRHNTITIIARAASIDPHLTNGGGDSPPSFRPHFLSNDGKVFFTSREALVPQDTNGVADVYEYDGPAGRLSLVTSGKGSEPMEFADASADGSDVFFLTRARLVPSDTDEFVDLYDARVGGGFDEPEPSPAAPCAGETCQTAGGNTATSAEPSSHAHTRGNVKPRHRRCGHGRHAVRRHGKVSCVRRHGKHNHRGKHPRREARANGGGAK